MFHRRQKYNAIPTEYNGIRYASKAEARRAEELDMLVTAGEVKWWTGQVPFRLGVAENKVVIDFLVAYKDGIVAEEVKGFVKPKDKANMKLWRAYGPVTLHVLSAKGKGWKRIIVDPTT